MSVVNKSGEVVAEGVTAETFVGAKKQWGKGCAVLVELCGGEELFVDTAKLLRRLPRDAVYEARLLRRVAAPPEGLDAAGHNVWVEA